MSNNKTPDNRPFNYLTALERKTVTADIRDIKRKLSQQSDITLAVDYNKLIQQLISKYSKVAGLALLQNRISAQEAKEQIQAYQTEIPKIFAQIFEVEHR